MTKVHAMAQLKAGSIDEACQQLSQLLGLDRPVSPQVLVSAIQSEEYARNLLVCRRTPAFLNTLLNNPVPVQAPARGPEKNAIELVKAASNALLRWGKVGFSVASEDVIEARLHACLACPHLRTHSTGAGPVGKLLKTKASCALCGCDVEKKSRMSSESCPGKDPAAEGLNRWGQAMSG